MLITKESAFKIFYYVIAYDGTVTTEETQKLDEIGLQLFGDSYSDIRSDLIEECNKKTIDITDDPEYAFEILSESVYEALNDTCEDVDEGIPSRLLLWNLLLVAHSDKNYDRNEKLLLKKINRKINPGDSVLFEMEQYVSTVQTIEKELARLKDSMEPYKIVRPIVDELENRQYTIKQAVMSLINDELIVQVEKLSIHDDAIDQAQTAIREKTDPWRKKINEQTGKVLGDVKKAATPAAAEAGKRIGKAFMGLGSKLMGKQSSDADEE